MTTRKLRELQRARLEKMLEAWLPVACNPDNEDSLKAVPVILKIMERQADLDDLDLSRELDGDGNRPAVDPVELAARVRAVSPMLAAFANRHATAE